MTIKVGFDPEVFFTNNYGKLLLPDQFTLGTKKNPVYGGEGIVGSLCDGVAVELNTSATASDALEFIKLVEMSREYLNSLCPRGVEVSHSSIARVPPEYYRTKAYKEIGCEPDYCVYRKKFIRPAQPRDLKGVRFAGGHIHVSTDVDPPLDKHVWARLLDIFLAPTLCGDGLERRQYITAGRIREKEPNYIEYRVPSNAWLWMDNGSLEAMFYDIEEATAIAWKHDEESLVKYESLVFAAINRGDTQAAEILYQIRDTEWVEL